MHYQVGTPGRIIVARFDDKEDIIENILHIARKENIRSGVIQIIGGIKQGRVVVGPEREEFPPEPVWKEIGESHEVLGFGTIFWQANEPKVHFHGAFGKKDMTKVGCLRGNSQTFLVLEVVITEIVGVKAQREFDPASGLTLLKV